MKKLIGIIGTAVIAMAMLFSANSINSSNGDLDLASLLSVNTANAEEGCNDATCNYYCYSGNVCILICAGVTDICYGTDNTP